MRSEVGKWKSEIFDCGVILYGAECVAPRGKVISGMPQLNRPNS